MLQLIKQRVVSIRYSIYASLSLAFASLGDAFLYAFLPQNAESLQVPVIWIGVLLSVNRFVRIVFNPIIVVAFRRFGIRNTTIVASVLAVVSSMGYGMNIGLAALLIFRILWGFSFSALRISTFAHAIDTQNSAISLGISKSIHELGPLFALWIGPLLLQSFSSTTAFICLAVSSLPSIVYACKLPQLQYAGERMRGINSRPSIFNLISFITTFIAEGMLVVVLGQFLLKDNQDLSAIELTSLVAFYLGLRRAFLIILPPCAGIFADRYGIDKVFNHSLVFIGAGLVLLSVGWTNIGLITIFIFNSINSTITAGNAVIHQTDKIRSIAVNASFRDVGTAAGTLVGGIVLLSNHHFEIFILATFILLIATLFKFKQLKSI